LKAALRIICVAGFFLIAADVCAAEPPLFAEPWMDGTHAEEAQTQTQRYDPDTYVIRQSLHTNPEGPFLYLLFGHDRVLLLDTGAGGLEIRPAVDAAISRWLAEHHRTSIPLVVAHSHGHGDHHAGDAEFQSRPDTTVIGLKPAEVAAFFKASNWPRTVARFDLGGRVLDVIPTPGHQPAHIMIFDERTRVLLSGDTLYAGRLYVPSNTFADFRDSIDRVVAFTKDRHVTHILGCHIEMTREAGKDYTLGAAAHPNEHVLELPYSDLLELQGALQRMGEAAVRDEHGDFIVFPLPPRPPKPEDRVPG
jgi:glyoxylase-like metal-dependent hydrolase (beta-lactamase superfamily II)